MLSPRRGGVEGAAFEGIEIVEGGARVDCVGFGGRIGIVLKNDPAIGEPLETGLAMDDPGGFIVGEIVVVLGILLVGMRTGDVGSAVVMQNDCRSF